ncbi:MAG: phosphoglycerate mutase [Gammaproteobacteria bacterium]|nr:phosphoglycerate mutase [Gammaproteobacteria bacterium]
MPELYLVRHAQASFATEDYDRLSETGQQQAIYLGEYFRERNISFDQVVSGDMHRHKQTLEGMARAMEDESFLDYKICPGFNEYDFAALVAAYGRQYPEDELYQTSSWENGDKKQFYRLLAQVLRVWQEVGLPGVPETWQEYQERIQKEIDLLKQSTNSGSRVLVMSSGGPISAFIGLVLDASAEKVIDLNLQTRNSGISHFFYNKEKMHLHEFNAIPHLQGTQRAELITYG